MTKVKILFLIVILWAVSAGAAPVGYFFMYGEKSKPEDFTGRSVASTYGRFSKVNRECAEQIGKVIDQSVKRVSDTLVEKQEILNEEFGAGHSLQIQYRIESFGNVIGIAGRIADANKCVLYVSMRDKSTGQAAEKTVLFYDRKHHMFINQGEGATGSDVDRLSRATVSLSSQIGDILRETNAYRAKLHHSSGQPQSNLTH